MVEPRLLDQLQQPNCQPPLNPTVKVLCDLDRQMKTVLDRDDMTEEAKAQEYNQVLRRYLVYQDKYDHRPPMKVQLTPSEETEAKDKENASTPLEKEVLETVPDKMKKKARLLLGRIRASSVMGWDDDGQLVYKGKTVQGSNVADLVNDVLRQRKHFNPTGWETFAQGLKETNVPQELVGHQERWDYMQNPASKEDARYFTPQQSNKKSKFTSQQSSKKKSKGERLSWTPY